MTTEIPTGKPLRLLHMLYKTGKPITTYTIQLKQSELAQQLNISRQALNVHLRKLRDNGHIRTGRGFIDVTEKGLSTLGISVNPAFVFVKVSPLRRGEVYQQLSKLPIERIFRVTGDMDAIIVIEQGKLDETLKKLAAVKGIQDTKSYVTIQTLK
ncbi:helix-turn-helix domain-containing protein [Candidatus Bathyarchaeota archaeon]|nr:helix-turn-helix domain-containing protein [Candidatus Bathyarchaeota archaeon]NIV44517.1 helix-turn-helix domain-containing protein [Candidatus Bathyarchaeota archaeon]